MPCVLNGIKAYGMRIQTLCDFLFYTIKGSATDEQNVARVNMHIILIRMLTTALGGDIHYATLK